LCVYRKEKEIGKYFLCARERDERDDRSLQFIHISSRDRRERGKTHAKKTRARGIQKAERRNKKRRLTSDFNSGSGFSAAAVAEDGLLAALLLLSAATTLMFLLLLDDDFCANCLLDKDLVVERTTEDAMRAALDEDEQQANALDIFCVALFVFLNARLALF
jgi:hypothetical protein